jgi:hypothetical protein
VRFDKAQTEHQHYQLELTKTKDMLIS